MSFVLARPSTAPSADPALAPAGPAPTGLVAELDAPIGRWATTAEALALVEAACAAYPPLARFAARLGNTPLQTVPSRHGGARIVAKCEWHNPAGSIKDRVAFALLCDLLGRPLLDGGPPATDRPVKILEYSGGNLARALATLGAQLGLPTRLVLSSASPASLLTDLAGHGAEVELVDATLGFLAVVQRARQLAAEDPSWTLLYQHRSTVNVAFHEATTGAEIVAQLAAEGARADAWVAAIGTGGTLTGVHRALVAANPHLVTVGVTPAELPYASGADPNGRPKIAGSGGMGHHIRQPFVASIDAAVDGHRWVAHADALAAMAELRQQTGLTVGSSAAANWLAACEVAASLRPDQTVATVFPCAGTPEEWARVPA